MTRSAAPDEPLAVEFLNTIWLDAGRTRDALESEAAAARWLDEMGRRGLLADVLGSDTPGSDAPPADVTDQLAPLLPDLRSLRTALRALALQAPESDAPELIVNGFAAAAPSSPQISWHGGVPVLTVRWSGTPAQNLLAALAAGGIVAICDTENPLLACAATRCIRLFTQRHRRRRWCSTACGNRMRVASHHARQRAADA